MLGSPPENLLLVSQQPAEKTDTVKVSENCIKFEEAYQNARKHILSGKTYKYLKTIQNG